jgi:hypothetical protein
MQQTTSIFKDRAGEVLPRYVWISSPLLAFLFSLLPGPNYASIGRAEWFWGLPSAFLSVYQSRDHPGSNPLDGSYYWWPWHLFTDWILWMIIFFTVAFISTYFSRMVWSKTRVGFTFLFCVVLPTTLWLLYLTLFWGLYYGRVFYYTHVA